MSARGGGGVRYLPITIAPGDVNFQCPGVFRGDVTVETDSFIMSSQ